MSINSFNQIKLLLQNSSLSKADRYDILQLIESSEEPSSRNDALLSRKQAADFLGINDGTLAVWKCTKRYDLPVVKVGRLVRYRMSDLLNFLESRTEGAKLDEQ